MPTGSVAKKRARKENTGNLQAQEHYNEKEINQILFGASRNKNALTPEITEIIFSLQTIRIKYETLNLTAQRKLDTARTNFNKDRDRFTNRRNSAWNKYNRHPKRISGKFSLTRFFSRESSDSETYLADLKKINKKEVELIDRHHSNIKTIETARENSMKPLILQKEKLLKQYRKTVKTA